MLSLLQVMMKSIKLEWVLGKIPEVRENWTRRLVESMLKNAQALEKLDLLLSMEMLWIYCRKKLKIQFP